MGSGGRIRRATFTLSGGEIEGSVRGVSGCDYFFIQGVFNEWVFYIIKFLAKFGIIIKLDQLFMFLLLFTRP